MLDPTLLSHPLLRDYSPKVAAWKLHSYRRRAAAVRMDLLEFMDEIKRQIDQAPPYRSNIEWIRFEVERKGNVWVAGSGR